MTVVPRPTSLSIVSPAPMVDSTAIRHREAQPAAARRPQCEPL